MDLDLVTRAYRTFREIMPDVRPHYAMKCNPDPRVLRRLRDLGCGFEIASTAELNTLRTLGVEPRAVLFSNPVKIPDHVRDAYAAGIDRFAVDSAAELAKIVEHAPGAGVYVRLATSPADSHVPSEGKFGVDLIRARELMRDAVATGLCPYGITFHVGSQMTDPTAWASAIERSGQLMTALRGDGIRVRMLDIGGGFPCAYASYTPQLKDFAKHIRTAVERYVPYAVDLVAEPGRALVAEAGIMVATVIGVAERRGRRWVHLDVGAFNGLMEALETGNQLRFPVSDSRRSPHRRPAHLTGPTCDSQDTILYDVPMSADLAVGDRVYLHSTGAYTTAYASHFNGFDPPAVHCFPD
jgi:ornithine decarboxylase